jgi:phosphatidylserine/phosphatidylglycerophosphate/cardiolipin synthase-like enzyme
MFFKMEVLIFDMKSLIFILPAFLIFPALIFARQQVPVEKTTISNNMGYVEIAFSPGGGITGMIVREIKNAASAIDIQAYSFTSVPIGDALAEAKKRGVKVRIILDKSDVREKEGCLPGFISAGIETRIDRAFAIAHSKVMIIDGRDVVTGSFNFTASAEKNNSENCIILHGNPEIAAAYEKDFTWRWENTEDYRGR